MQQLRSNNATQDFELLTLKKAYQKAFSFVTTLEAENEAYKNQLKMLDQKIKNRQFDSLVVEKQPPAKII